MRAIERRVGRRNEKTRMVMTKRLKELAAEATENQVLAQARDLAVQARDLAVKVRDSANQIWLAGLGAFSKAQQEGANMFETLVAEGEKFQERTKGAADERLTDMRENVTGAWNKVEKVFEDPAGAYNKLEKVFE